MHGYIVPPLPQMTSLPLLEQMFQKHRYVGLALPSLVSMRERMVRLIV